METFEIAGRQVLILAILVLYLGNFITNRTQFLQDNNIPQSVTGGLVCSVIVALLAGFQIVDLSFDLDLRNLLLLIFFSTIGLNAKIKYLVKGGYALVVLIVACTFFLVFQNIIGVSVAKALGYEPFFGLFGGSISLAGGHGTAIAWGEIAVEKGFNGASEFGIACATFGLILGGLLGGPISGRLIKKYNLMPEPKERIDSQAIQVKKLDDDKSEQISVEDVIGTIFALALCLGFGDAVNHYLFSYEIRLPGFLTAMMIGVIITNIADPLKFELNHGSIGLVGGISLQLFLAMSLMSMDLLSLADSAILLVSVMTLQALGAVLFAVFVVFRMMGKDYDAAMIVGGFIGLGLGATPVAIASMDVVSRKYGSSVKALLIVPLVGAFFIDLVNAMTIQIFLKLPFM